jgi:hypothetical protein
VVAKKLGYAGHFAVAAGLSAVGLLFAWQAIVRGKAPPERPMRG